MRILTFCKQCHKALRIIPAEIKRGRGKFCSRDCYTESKRISMKGNKNYNWKGGIVIQMGYAYLFRPDHPKSNKKGYIKRANIVYEDYTGHYPEKGYVIHHKDLNKLNDEISNLILMDIPSHFRKHTAENKNLKRYYERNKKGGRNE